MHRTARMRHMAVQAGMQPPSGGIGRILALGAFGIIGVDHPEVRGADTAEMTPRIDQELRPLIIDRHREMIGHPLMHPFARGEAKRSR